MVAVRILIDPGSEDDIAKVHALQDGIVIEQQSAGRFEIPNWDPDSQKKVREALLVSGRNRSRFQAHVRNQGRGRSAGAILSASRGSGGGNTEKDAIYLTVVPTRNDGKTVHRLTVKGVPVDGFWSITVYNEKGYLELQHCERLFAEQHHRGERRRRIGERRVRRLRTARHPTACRSCRAGTTRFASIVRARNFLVGSWKFPEAEPVARVRRALRDLGRRVVLLALVRNRAGTGQAQRGQQSADAEDHGQPSGLLRSDALWPAGS